MKDVDQVAEAIRLVEAEMRPIMRIDEISSIVGRAVSRSWCQALEKEVSTGLLITQISSF